MRTALLEDLRHDIRYARRMLRSNPGFAAIAILILAVGIGATTAIFSVVNATLLRPLPFREPDRLMAVFLRMPVQYGSGEIDMTWSYPKYQAFLSAQRTFSDAAIHIVDAFNISTDDGAERVLGESVSARYFSILGLTPERGRFFLDGEDRPTGGDRSIVLSDAYWRERYGGAESALGGVLEVNGFRYTIVGVAPPGFAGMSGTARLWPLFTAVRGLSTLQSSTTHQFDVVARLTTNATVSAAKTDMVNVGRVVNATYPDEGGGTWRAAGYTLQELRVDPMVGRSVVLLAIAVSMLLLIACVNVANLLLARAAARRRELAVRLAIGAGRGRLVRQLLTETAMLSTAGVIAGLVLAAVAVRALAAMTPLAAANLSTVRGTLTAISLGRIALDGRAAGAAVLAAMFTGLVAGLIPGLVVARLPVADAMRQGAVAAPTFSGLRRLTIRGALVMAEIALAVVLLVTSGLMVRTLGHLFDAQVGYRPDGVLTARIGLAPGRATSQPIGALWNAVIERVATLPGVTRVAVGSCAPVGDHCEGTDIRVAGHSEQAHVSFHVVTPGYVATLGIPIVRGREVSLLDRPATQPVMVINATAARTIWGTDDPLTTPVPRDDRTINVVGVAGECRPQRGQGGGSQPYGVRCADAPAAHVRSDGARPVRDAGAERIRRDGPGAGGDRHLRRTVARRGAAPPRARDPHGVRCRARWRAGDDSRAGDEYRRGRWLHWRGGRALRWPSVRQHVVWGESGRPGHLPDVWPGAGRRGLRGGHCPGGAGHAGASDDRAPIRLMGIDQVPGGFAPRNASIAA